MHYPDKETSSYAQTSKVSRLSDWTLAKSYTPLPDDWLIFVADVTGSTQAIAQGLSLIHI